MRELEKEFPDCGSFGDERLKNVLNQIFAQKREGFVFVMDEWDCVFRLAKNREDVQKEYLDFLRSNIQTDNVLNGETELLRCLLFSRLEINKNIMKQYSVKSWSRRELKQNEISFRLLFSALNRFAEQFPVHRPVFLHQDFRL